MYGNMPGSPNFEGPYGEFQEACVAICTYKHPNPYVCLDVRFMRFIDQIYRQAKQLPRFRGKIRWVDKGHTDTIK